MKEAVSIKFSLRNVKERKEIARTLIEPLLKAKRDHSLVKIYDRIAPGPNGRSHTTLSPDTSTFRFSSGESDLFPNSTNWQNIPKKVTALDPLYKARDCVIADEGHTLIAVDYSGAEAVLAAAYSRDWEFLDKLLAGADVHAEHAQLFNNVSKEDWDARGGKSDPQLGSLRNVAKNVTYASLYMASPFRITETINKDSHITGIRITQDEVIQARNVLLQLHPLERWWEETRLELEQTGGVTRNCFGYRRVFRDPDSHGRLKDALSNYPQSTVAWLMNQTILTLEHTPFPGELLLQIHDELFFQCPTHQTEELRAIVSPLMLQPFTIKGRELYIPIEWKAGERWGIMKAITH